MKLKLHFSLIKLVSLIGLMLLLVAVYSSPTFAQTANPANNDISADIVTASTTKSVCAPTSFFGLEPWYQYLTVYTSKHIEVNGNPVCQVCFNVFGNQQQNNHCNKSRVSDISLVLLAIVDDLLRIAGIVAIVMVLYSSVTFITSQGEPEAVAKARSSIINALIGAAIAIVAIAAVSFIGSKLGGG